MDTTATFNHKKLVKSLKFGLLFILLISLTACPGNEDCFDMANTTTVDDLIKLTPEQTEYNQGDEVTLSLSIPATNTYFGNARNFFEDTNDDSAQLTTASSSLFNGNTLEFIKGQQGGYVNWFYFPYNPETDTYDFEIKITLNRTGDYSFRTSELVDFVGDGCNRYFLETNIEWSEEGIIEFTVVE